MFNHLLSTSQFIAIFAVIAAAGLALYLRGRTLQEAKPSGAREAANRTRG